MWKYSPLFTMRRLYIVSLVTFVPLSTSQSVTSLSAATGQYDQLSNFTSLITDSPTLLSTIFSSGPNITLLVPSDAAFASYKNATGTSLADLSVTSLSEILSYHVLVSPVSSTTFQAASKGLTIPTYLTDTEFNNRTAGSLLLNQYGNSAKGQVLFFSPTAIPGTKKRSVQVRQTASQGGTTNVRSGLGKVAEINLIDGQWNGGYFQIVNT
jgi:hypothetical protein